MLQNYSRKSVYIMYRDSVEKEAGGKPMTSLNTIDMKIIRSG